MKTLLHLCCGGLAMLAPLIASQAATATVGQAAPDFTLTDLNGVARSLSDFRGKIVVLEWVNPECPFVRKHYESGNIPALQKKAVADGVVWLSINSAAAGQQGDFDAAEVKAWQARVHSSATDYFRDQDGKVGHRYDARTTPHLFIVDPAGTLVYAGGIDSIRSTRVSDIAKATNYVAAALEDLHAGRPVRTPHSQPYGCSVKY